LVHANLSEWMDAHPCDCEAVCECEQPGDEACGMGKWDC
jgi:hypothetical protein